MAAMVPTPTSADKQAWRARVERVVARLVAHRVPLAWSVALWAAVVGLPWLALSPEAGLRGRVFVSLALLGPVLTLSVAALGSVTSLYGTSLVTLVAPLVAAPVLSGPRVASAVQGLVVAGLLLGLTASVLDRDNHARHTRARRVFRALFAGNHAPLARRVVLALGVVWLAMAWMQPGAPAVRAARVIAVALLWTWVLIGRLGPPRPGVVGLRLVGRMRDARGLPLTRRPRRVEVGPAVAWRVLLALALGAVLTLWWWQAPAPAGSAARAAAVQPTARAAP
jgi:hypothetical protein